MKLFIEVHLDPDEIPLADDLLRNLKVYADKLKVNGKNQERSQVAANNGEVGEKQAYGVSEPVRKTMQAAVPSSLGTTSVSSRGVSPTSSISSNATVPVLPKHERPRADRAKRLEEILLWSAEVEQPEEGSMTNELQRLGFFQKINALLPSDNAPEEEKRQALIDLHQAYHHALFDKENVQRSTCANDRPFSVVPMIFMLQGLPVYYTDTASQERNALPRSLLQDVMQSLHKDRPLQTERTEFFGHAEAFATMVHLEHIKLEGAIHSINKLIKQPEKRCAAVTMLGKTVELCYEQFQQTNEPIQDHLATLRAELGTCEDIFKYDVTYIMDFMSWTSKDLIPTPSSNDSARGAASGPPEFESLYRESMSAGANLQPQNRVQHQDWKGIQFSKQFQGHQQLIHDISYDPKRDILITAGRDSDLISWGSDGSRKDTFHLERHYACSMDVHPNSGALVVCGVPLKSQQTMGTQCVMYFEPQRNYGEGMWSSPHMMTREDTWFFCAKAIEANGNSFVTSESVRTDIGGMKQETEFVCVYDVACSRSFETMDPIVRYTEHTERVSCLSALTTEPCLFISGSKDSTLRLWDVRKQRSVGCIGSEKAREGKDGKMMVTSVDARFANEVWTTSMNGIIATYDIRQFTTPIAQMNLDNTAALKVATLGSSSVAAICTLNGVYHVDMRNPTKDLVYAYKKGPDRDRVYQLRYVAGHNAVYAGGESTQLDKYVQV